MSQSDKKQPISKPPIPNIKGVAAPQPKTAPTSDLPPQSSMPARTAGRIRLSSWAEDNAQNMIAMLGYGLIGYGLIDYVDILVPARLMNPEWELGAITGLIAKVWAPLFGLVLIFCRRQGSLGKREMNLLNILSWASFGLAVMYFAIVPLSISNAMRLSQSNTAQVNSQLSQQATQLEQARLAIDQAESTADLARLIAPNQPAPNITDVSPAEVKQDLLAQISQVEQQTNANAQLTIQSTQKNILKRTILNVFTCLLSGWLFFKVWKFSVWARQWKRFAS
jgi:hypothetical protein